MLGYVGDHKDEFSATYGNIATQSLGGILRALLPFGAAGGATSSSGSPTWTSTTGCATPLTARDGEYP